MDSVEKRIEKAIRLSGLRYRNEFAKLIGVTPDALKKWEKRGKISPNGILKIINKVPISKTYLETGEGDPQVMQSNINNGIQGVGNISGSSNIQASGAVERDGHFDKDDKAREIYEEALKLDENGKKKVLSYIWKLQGIIDE